MERKMSRPWSGFRVLCVIFLLGLENGAFGSIDPGNLKKIFKYITDYGIKNNHYAVAARLDGEYCKDPSPANLQAALPPSEMNKMHNAINVKNGIYNPKPIGNVVAARPNFKAKGFEHAEWRLLTGGQNSLTAKILENKPSDSCLIFFSKLSPCTDRCLNEKDMRNFVQWLNPLFNQLNEDSRAFVFETFYGKDSDKEPAVVVAAWKTIKDAPLFRCDDKNAACIKCFDNNDQVNARCLAKGYMAKTTEEGGQSWQLLG
ncbi:hypothetical protein lerEdw1_006537 [Lerista edwardsae]|nr:hypothetical protein lerEdw1_006537 [Lerista edwardsae]